MNIFSFDRKVSLHLSFSTRHRCSQPYSSALCEWLTVRIGLSAIVTIIHTATIDTLGGGG